jgi:hypothetical protein
MTAGDSVPKVNMTAQSENPRARRVLTIHPTVPADLSQTGRLTMVPTWVPA